MRPAVSLLAVFLLVLVAVLGMSTEWATAAAPTRLSVSRPPIVGLGEEISLEAHLTAADGRPIAGAVLTLLQVGAVGQRVMTTATTDAQGVAWFSHNEFTVTPLSLRIVYAGDSTQAPAGVDLTVEVTGIEVPPAVVMPHAPTLLVRSVLFLLLGTVWLTYAFAASSILRIVREGRTRQGGETVRVVR